MRQSECYLSLYGSLYHKRTKHIGERYHKIRQWVMDDKLIDLVKISTKKNPAYMMMKTISMEKFRASLTSSRFSKSKVTNGLLGGSHVKSQKGEKARRMKQRPISTEGLNEYESRWRLLLFGASYSLE